MHHAINKYQLRSDVQHFLWPVHYIALYCIILYCIVLYYIILYDIMQVLYFTFWDVIKPHIAFLKLQNNLALLFACMYVEQICV